MAKSRAAVPPDNTDSTTPSPVKHVTIPKAYRREYLRILGAGPDALASCVASFVKNASVTGISGNTQGVNNVTSPATNAVAKNGSQSC